MKQTLYLSLILFFSLSLWGCKDSSTGSGSDLNEAPSEKEFVWDAMNFWYYWVDDVPELADDHAYFESEQEFHKYLIGFNSPAALFDDLLFSDDNFGENIGEDDFSFFINDYEAFHQAQQGNTFSFGFEYGLVQQKQNGTELFGYVQYIVPDTPAEEAGLERGDIFTAVNGTDLTVNNYRNALSGDSYELTLADFNDGNPTENGEVIQVNATSVQEDPIHVSKVIETGSAKVGYLLYNSFQRNSHQDLNDVIGNFLEEDIDELVLDLRYNGGGAVITSAVLASMISGVGASEEFAVYSFNSKRSDERTAIDFQDEVPLYNENGIREGEVAMNTLAIDRLFVLTGFGTASASEAVINGLKPFMDDVILIGWQTVGKDDASLTLYDAPAPYTNRSQANPDHKYAIQPIVLKVVNSIGESNGEGFIPDHPLNELSFLDDLPPLGDENEPLLARALELISGEPVAKALATKPPYRIEAFKDSRDLEKFGNEMYILPEEAESLLEK